jgi:phosphoribosylaminoimidazolecarboxamide formyltransferase/IMP cyclohydrolase
MKDYPLVALLSAFTKDDALLGFAEGLVKLGWQLLASTGTKRFLDSYGIVSKDVADIVGPPILDHRVVTLSRELFAAILADLDSPADLEELKRIGVDPISLVCVDFYPLEKELENKGRSFRSVIERTDIGGPTLLHAAAKGRRWAVSSPDQYERMLHTLQRSLPHEFRERALSLFAAEAEKVVSDYVALSAGFHKAVADNKFPITPAKVPA